MDRPGTPRLVGRAHFARQRGRISTTFLYDPGYLSEGGMSIDPALPLVSGAQHQSRMVDALVDDCSLSVEHGRERMQRIEGALAGWRGAARRNSIRESEITMMAEAIEPRLEAVRRACS